MVPQTFFQKAGVVALLFCSLLVAGGCSARLQAVKSSPSQVVPLPVSATVLPQVDATIFQHGSRTEKVVALTFDADMTPKMKKDLQTGVVKSWDNLVVTDFLQKEHVKATLFITGMWAEIYPDEVKRLAADPLFEIGNHSYSHPGFHQPCYGLADATDKTMEVMKTQKVLQDLIGYTPKYFRFPGGCSSDADVKLVSSLGIRAIGWDDISGDAYIRDDAEKIVMQTMKDVQPGSIIVMHMHGGRTAPLTGEALPEIVRLLRARGYRFVTVGELMGK